MNRQALYTLIALAALRVLTGLLFLGHGTQNFLSLPAFESAGSDSLGAWAGIVELTTGVLVTLGFLTRPAAFLASGTMAFAYFIGHAFLGFFPVNNRGDWAVLYCFVFLLLVFTGPGAISVDEALEKRRVSH